jgi:hypothetical protein
MAPPSGGEAMMFKSGPAVTFQNSLEGTWGEFATPTGRVAFILTKARLGKSGTDAERRLTGQLRPVREVLPVDQMDFNQLLQRDLDDHRVAMNLIPYLLQPAPTGPAFFPPIMAVLLPFENQTSASRFPRESSCDNVMDSGVPFEERRYGEAYRFQRLITEDGKPHSIKLGRLGWNDEYAKLVVLDGQHRAMALLAIDRTINNQWGTSSGKQFRHFYEHRVKELLSHAKANLDAIEIPVTVCWFPDLNGPDHDPHRAARKLFVDVNKEARTPSEARLTLLSDTELVNIFTRNLLNKLRGENPPLPLYAVEYDNPDRDAARPVRWSVFTNLNLIKVAVLRTVFGPKKYLNDMAVSFGGRQPLAEMDAFMREQLDITSLFPSAISDGDRLVQRDAVGNMHFPTNEKDVGKLISRFHDTWGAVVLTVLAQLRPYRAHSKALQYICENWSTDDTFSSLARDALFAGVGMFWTLKDSNDHWIEKKEQCRREKKPEPTPPDIIQAWTAIEKKRPEFQQQRAREYLNRKAEKDIERTNRFYDAANTQACQLGAILTVASLAMVSNVAASALPSFAERIVAAWNAALESKRSGDEPRLLFFAREPAIKSPINRLGRMDSSFAVYFRYFWLELLQLDVAKKTYQDILSLDVVAKLCHAARDNYVSYLVEEQFKALRVSEPSKREETLRKQAQKNVLRDLTRALVYWCEYTDETADAAISGSLTGATATTSHSEAELPEEAPTTENKSLSDVLSELPED